MGPYVSHSILYSGGGTLDVVESIEVHGLVQDDSVKKISPPWGWKDASSSRAEPSGFPVQASPGLQYQEPLKGPRELVDALGTFSLSGAQCQSLRSDEGHLS